MSASRRAFRRQFAAALGEAWRGGGRAGPQTPSTLLWGATLLTGGALAGAGVTLWMQREGHLRARGSPDEPAAGPLQHPAAAHGLPVGSETLRSFGGFVSCWDARSRNPRWVLERLCASDATVGDRANVTFTEDAALDPRFRSRLEDYRGSGYDRGHVAAAANHKRSQSDLEATFTMSNVSPQVGAGFNRDYWARLEKWVRDLIARCDQVFVVSGPLFLPVATPSGRWRLSHELIGTAPRLVSVPTHFFKVVLTTSKRQGTALAAFVVPNAAVDPAQPLIRFLVPLRDLEEAAGLKFFPRLGEEERQAFAEEEEALLASVRHDGARRPLLLLPPPEAKQGKRAVTAVENAQQVVRASPPAARRPGTPAPLCAVESCALPAANWWAAHKHTAPAEVIPPTAAPAPPPPPQIKD